jgi:glycerol-3-phosphate dehydrogenase (NAD(P)+)
MVDTLLSSESRGVRRVRCGDHADYRSIPLGCERRVLKPVDAEGPRIAILNAGAWGTALAIMLARAGRPVRLWARRRKAATALAERRESVDYLPGVRIPDSVEITADLGKAVEGSQIAVVVVVSNYLRQFARELSRVIPPDTALVHGTKGFEPETLLRGSEVLQQEIAPRGGRAIAVLAGPTHAEEVARGVPTAATVACPDIEVACRVQAALMTASFRLYTNADIVGVEVCSALKNVVALAAGASDGLGYGDNTKAALITRGLAEMGRLVAAQGGQLATVTGLAGLGDIVATCTSQHSRNRRAGEQLGRGWTLKQVLASTPQVVEGVPATRAAAELAARHHVDLPITEQVYGVLFEARRPIDALTALMGRQPRHEH